MIGDFVTDLRKEALRLGLSDLGIAAPDPSGHMGFFRDWISRGMHGEMGYLARPDTVARRADLTGTFPDVRSVVVVAQEYGQDDPPGVPRDPSRAVIARYARGEDYHDVLKDRLQDLLAWIRRKAPERGLAREVGGVVYVDTGPILERELARRAGLGWFGKNTMLIHPRRGSWFFLGVILLDLELPSDPSFEADHCGSCRACLDACPTGALLDRDETGAAVLDSRLCISYLTIELRGPIPEELRDGMGNRVFGCDICQEVCPWNRKFGEPSEEPAFRAGPDTDGPSLVELMGMAREEFSERFSGSPIKRAKRRGFLRNVAVALGNWMASADGPSEEAVAVLRQALEDEEPLVREHVAWALGLVLERAGFPGDRGYPAAEALLRRLEVEEDERVREVIERALGG